MTVLVVGAGPVGLTAANSLAHFGVPVRIIDSRAAPTQLSKALVIWRRSLHTLDPVIPFESWMPPGRQVVGVNLADSGSIFAAVNMDTLPPQTAPADAATATATAAAPCQHMLPPGLFITQAQIEAGLEQHLQDKFHIKVQRSTALESFTVDEEVGGVRCVLGPTAPAHDPAANTTPSANSTPSTTEHEEVLVSHLIGCDGARSAVRKGLGIPFPGYSDPDNRFLMMDCTYEYQPGINSNRPRSEAEGKPDPSRPMASTSAVGLILSIPLVGTPGAIRLVWNAGEHC
jgi:2-polyprenyl-6-methoxyphenol hydroxylase-like FAD-dependent oxidoreductase